MAELPLTRPSLLVRIRDARDKDAWRQFVQIYSPVVYGYARKRGLQDADAADLTQEVLGSVMTGVRRLDYDPQRGSFSGWLFTVAHHRLHDLQSGQKRQVTGNGDTAALHMLAAQPAREEESALWAREYQQSLFTWAAERARDGFHESTWRAFWQTAVEGRCGKEVAESLGMTVAAVYLAKSRVLTRLREQIRQLDSDNDLSQSVADD